MARRRRSFIPGVPHHVVQRAAHRLFIMDSDEDRAVLVSMIERWQQATGVKIASFVLMGNHFHLVLVAADARSLSKFMSNVCSEYSRYVNARRGTSGPNWQGRFYSAPMDLEHTVAAIRYIERNPVAAGMVARACDWQWSSARFHAGLGKRPSILDLDLIPPEISRSAWLRSLDEESPPEFRRLLREATALGRPLGGDAWRSRMEAMLSISPRRKRGRPAENGDRGARPLFTSDQAA